MNPMMPINRVDFNRLAAKVKEDTKYDSGFQGILDHPAHKEIRPDYHRSRRCVGPPEKRFGYYFYILFAA